jgi:hypothetical protein
MSLPAASTETLRKAERYVIRCAMGIVNSDGWSFEMRSQENVVIFPAAMRRLESAIAKLQEARKSARRKR